MVANTEPLGGDNAGWKVEIDPASADDVTISMPMRPCGSPGAVCTSDNRALTNSIEMTIPGPATVSVADAEVREGPDATLDFVITLSRPKDERVRVFFETEDGTAIAGEDYSATDGRVVFAPGIVSMTVTVPVLDDDHDEGSETLTFRLLEVITTIDGVFRGRHSMVLGAVRHGDATATGTIHNTDPLPKQWIARFGRAVGNQVVDAVTDRLGSSPYSHVTVAGMRFQPSMSVGAVGGWLSWAARRSQFGGTLADRDLLLRSAFHLASGGRRATEVDLAAWGGVATGSFRSRVDGIGLEGDVTTGYIGLDASWEPDTRRRAGYP